MRKSSKKLFIVGVGRSGTSLLQAMMGSHTDVEFRPETGFFRRFVLDQTLQRTFESQGIDAVMGRLGKDARILRLKLDFEKVRSAEFDKHNLDIAVYEWILNSSDHVYVGDKDPRNVESLDILLNKWPDAKILHIYRDPRDVLASKKVTKWSRDKSLFFHLVAGTAQFRLGLHHQKSKPESVMLVNYESLLADPEDCLQSICQWLEIEFQPAMLNYGSTAERLVAKDELQWKKETFGPLLKNNSGKWKTQLSPFEIAAVQNTCREAMALGKYEPARPSLWTTLLATPLSLAVRFAARTYERRRLNKNQVVADKI